MMRLLRRLKYYFLNYSFSGLYFAILSSFIVIRATQKFTLPSLWVTMKTIKPELSLQFLLAATSLLGGADAFTVQTSRARLIGLETPTVAQVKQFNRSPTGTQLNLFSFFRRNKSRGQEEDKAESAESTIQTTGPDEVKKSGNSILPSRIPVEEADIVIIGGGVSGLTAAITASQAAKKGDLKIVLLESSSRLGGRVMSEVTDDGYTLDEGFAVFLDEYPEVRKVLDFEALKLKPFLPGALVKLKNRNGFARVADPLREPGDIFNSILAPVGSLIDKAKVIPLFFNVKTKSVEELFVEHESDTETALIERWGFSDDFIAKFYKPFLEGIYLAPLSQQSSRMFSFVFKMFSEGSATLPEGGMIKVADQLVEKAKHAGVDIKLKTPVTRLETKSDGSVIVESAYNSKQTIYRAKSVIVATDGKVARKLLSQVDDSVSLEQLPEQPQLTVGCLYYSFEGTPPVEDPILILNGEESDDLKNPVNNVCFPSVVNKGYAPEGYSLCSVTVLGPAMEAFKNKPEELDQAVRQQLGTWFCESQSEIREEWELRKIFFVSYRVKGGASHRCWYA
jgi:phytoene dehydrogenase-like protein